MNPLQGCHLELEVDEMLQCEVVLPLLFAGHTPRGQHYLVLQVARDDHSWICAPISERGLTCVRTGQADLHAAFTHTATGAIDLVTVAADGQWTETLKLCRDLADEDLPPVGTHLCLCA